MKKNKRDTLKYYQLNARLDKLNKLANTTFTKREPSIDRYTCPTQATGPTQCNSQPTNRARSTER